MASQDGIDNMKRYRIKAQQIISAALWLAEAVALALLLKHVSEPGNTSYHTYTLYKDTVLAFIISLPMLVMNIRKIVWGSTDILILSLAGIYFACSIINRSIAASVALQEAFPYAVLYFCIRVFICSGKGISAAYLVVILSLWSCCESSTGLLQAFGYRPSGHSAFGITGSFQNPGPYGGFISIMMSISIAYSIRFGKSWKYAYSILLKATSEKKRRHTYLKWIVMRLMPLVSTAAATFLAFLVLPSSRSRAGWLGLCFALLLFVCRGKKSKNWFKQHKAATVMLPFVAALVFTGTFLMKKDSALGRLHIWNMEIHAIASAPLIGNGPGMALGAYGKAQEAYFRGENHKSWETRVAGCPEYAFNEYLKTGMETGIPGLLLIVSISIVSLITLLKTDSIFAYGLAAALVFAFFSYPLSVKQLTVLYTFLFGVSEYYGRTGEKPAAMIYRPFRYCISVLVASALLFAILPLGHIFSERQDSAEVWSMSRHWTGPGFYMEAAEELEKIYPEMSWNYRYLYDYGYALHKVGDYSKSTEVLLKGTELSSDPMFHNIIGRNYESVGLYKEAEKEYLISHYMVPCRLYPMVLLFEMYSVTGQVEKAENTRRAIMNMPVNPKNKTMTGLKERIEK